MQKWNKKIMRKLVEKTNKTIVYIYMLQDSTSLNHSLGVGVDGEQNKAFPNQPMVRKVFF